MSMYHWGAIVVTPDFTDLSIIEARSNFYSISVTMDNNGIFDAEGWEAVKHQARRVVTVTAALQKALKMPVVI